MKITEFQSPDLIKVVTLYPNDLEPTKMTKFYHIDEPDHHEGVVYFITVDDEIVKVGGSQNTIKQLIGQYCLNLGKADPQFNRFPIYLMILDLLCKGHTVSFYYTRVQPYTIVLPSLINGKPNAITTTAFEGFETGYINMVKELNGDYPIWNSHESGNSFDDKLRKLWLDRKAGLSNDGLHFDYQSYLNREWNFI